MLGSIFLTIISIIFLMIFFDANLYDELRHILYLIPLILIVTFSIIYFFSRKLLLFLSIASIFIFTIQNFNMYPYQYTWFNLFSNFIDVNKNFEIDYWGVSGKNLQKKIIEYVDENSISKDICVHGDEFVKDFLITKGFKCFKRYNQLDAAKNRPVLAYKNLRNAKRSNPRDCKLIWDETYHYSFYNKNISVGTLWWCD